MIGGNNFAVVVLVVVFVANVARARRRKPETRPVNKGTIIFHNLALNRGERARLCPREFYFYFARITSSLVFNADACFFDSARLFHSSSTVILGVALNFLTEFIESFSICKIYNEA